MGRDILSEFGPESYRQPASGAADGGTQQGKDVMGYRPPVGPVGINHYEPGLGGRNCGNRGTQESRSVFGDGAGGSIYSGQICKIQGRY
jgi:hypothetical protein